MLRPGDIVISTPPKSGTTLMQMLCALLIFDGPDFPAPLEQVSPWLDMSIRPVTEVFASLAAQTHRRVIKTHTPLDGLPLHDEVTYLVVGRDPRDVAISWEHHAANMDFELFLKLRSAAIGNADLADLPQRTLPSPDPVERFQRFITEDMQGGPPTLASVLHHLDTGWQRQHAANVTLFHYSDLTGNPTSELLRLATILGVPSAQERARELVAETSLERMRARALEIAPSASRGTWKDVQAFFRNGGSGEWQDRVSSADVSMYEARVAALVGPDLAAWAHGGRRATGVNSV